MHITIFASLEHQKKGKKRHFLPFWYRYSIILARKTTITLDNQITVVTEETSSNNDNKLFKKIPSICKELNVECIGLPKLIELFNKEINVQIKNTSA